MRKIIPSNRQDDTAYTGRKKALNRRDIARLKLNFGCGLRPRYIGSNILATSAFHIFAQVASKDDSDSIGYAAVRSFETPLYAINTIGTSLPLRSKVGQFVYVRFPLELRRDLRLEEITGFKVLCSYYQLPPKAIKCLGDTFRARLVEPVQEVAGLQPYGLR